MIEYLNPKMGWASATLEKKGDISYINNTRPLPAYPDALFHKFDEHADLMPGVVALADRRCESGWREVTYAELRDKTRRIAQFIINAGVTVERGVAIMAPNSIDHALVAYACLRIGVPYAPITPAYALLATDYEKLRYVMQLMNPGLLYVDNSEPFSKAIAEAMPSDIKVMALENAVSGMNLADAIATEVTQTVMDMEARVNADTVAKLLFTSGSTGMPKAVINTQRMMCANQVMIRETYEFLKNTPPVLVDWLPWNHTAGGNHDIGLTLFNGGTFHIDDGKPVPAAIKATVDNLKDVSPTVYFNVPKGYELLVAAMEDDEALKQSFFARLEVIQYSGAGLSPHVFDSLIRMSQEVRGKAVPIVTGYGATETAPAATCPIGPMKEPGRIGLPVSGLTFKLVPNGSKLELRLKGPNITPGYWSEPQKTAEAFDEEGFYCIKDAVKLVDDNDVNKGLIYDGRVAEDFKLDTGTWVSFVNVRNGLLAAASPILREVVLTGHNRGYIGALVFLDVEQARKLSPELAQASEAELAYSDPVRNHMQAALVSYKAASTGSSNRVRKCLIMTEPASLESGEMTDKGSVNQRSVLEKRADLVEALYEGNSSPAVLSV
jgi:feruloyl-CoA synthase